MQLSNLLLLKFFYAPGKVSNAGGVATSGLEMSQNALRFGWTHGEVDERLPCDYEDIHANCFRYGTKEDGRSIMWMVRILLISSK